METIKIGERKLKIMLTEDDLLSYELSRPLDVASDDGRSRMLRLLRDACVDTDFDPDSGRVFVQIYESVSGGCELFVTQRDNFIGGGEMMTPRAAIQRTRKERGIYAFPDIDSLLAVCGRLARPGRGDTAVYAGRGGGYYLITYDAETKTDAICGEYGGERCLPSAEAFLCEHCQLICGHDAVGVLGALG